MCPCRAFAPVPFVRGTAAQASSPLLPSPYAGRGDRWPSSSDRPTRPRSAWRRRISSPGCRRAARPATAPAGPAGRTRWKPVVHRRASALVARTSASFLAFVRNASAKPFHASACASVIFSSARRKAMRPSTRSMVAIPSMPRPIMPIMCIIPIECIADMLLIMFFMSFIMGMLPIPPPIMPAPPCGAAARGSVREPEWPGLIFRCPRGGNGRARPGPAPTPEPQVPRP